MATFQRNILAMLVLMTVSTSVFAQTQDHDFLHHRLALMIAHTHVPGAQTGTEGSAVIVPSWALNYEYWLNHQWAVGIHSDMEIATYIIENHESTEIERERPIIISTAGIFKPLHQVLLIAGFGREIEKHQNFWVIRFGVEYEFDLRGGWDLAPALGYDIKESVYDSWTIGLTVGKRL